MSPCIIQSIFLKLKSGNKQEILLKRDEKHGPTGKHKINQPCSGVHHEVKTLAQMIKSWYTTEAY